jgi:hypothetical protein
LGEQNKWPGGCLAANLGVKIKHLTFAMKIFLNVILINAAIAGAMLATEAENSSSNWTTLMSSGWSGQTATEDNFPPMDCERRLKVGLRE